MPAPECQPQGDHSPVMSHTCMCDQKKALKMGSILCKNAEKTHTVKIKKEGVILPHFPTIIGAKGSNL